ncbi:MAG: C39 family peptidase [Patescibacteria group bacterium]
MKTAIKILAIVIIVAAAMVFLRRESTAPVVSPSISSQYTTSSPQRTSTVAPTSRPTTVLFSDVPFTSQAPFGGWDDPRQQDGCEEASALMAVRWARGQTLSSDEALKEILAAADYEEATYGSYHDTNAQDTVTRIFKGYFKFDGATAKLDITAKDIEAALRKGMLVVVPANGQLLGNPNYTAPGPDRHMLVIIGYDPNKDEFITNDPGTRKGKGYRYKSSVLERAIFNYPTGDHVETAERRTAMITIQK